MAKNSILTHCQHSNFYFFIQQILIEEIGKMILRLAPNSPLLLLHSNRIFIELQIGYQAALRRGKSYRAKIFAILSLFSNGWISQSYQFKWKSIGNFLILTRQCNFLVHGSFRICNAIIQRKPGAYLGQFLQTDLAKSHIDIVPENRGWMRLVITSAGLVTFRERSERGKSVRSLSLPLFLNKFEKRYRIGLCRKVISEIMKRKTSTTSSFATPIDLLAISSYLANYKSSHFDNIKIREEISNRRLFSVGNLLQTTVRKYCSAVKSNLPHAFNKSGGWRRVEGAVIEGVWKKRVNGSLISSPLFQFGDQLNSLADLTQKIRLVNFYDFTSSWKIELRRIHESQLRVFCPVDTSIGRRVGRTATSTLFMKIQDSSTLVGIRGTESRKIHKSGDCLSFTDFDNSFSIQKDRLGLRFNDFQNNSPSEIAPSLYSIGTNLIPFFFHSDGNRILIGTTQIRQAVPIIKMDPSRIFTKWDRLVRRFAKTSRCDRPGLVFSTQRSQVRVLSPSSHSPLTEYRTIRVCKSNQSRIEREGVRVKVGDWIDGGDLIMTGSGCEGGMIKGGNNLLVRGCSWDGLTIEDGVLVSNSLTERDRMTSVRIENWILSTRIKIAPFSPLFSAMLDFDINSTDRRTFDYVGLVGIGTWVKRGDIMALGLKQKPLSAQRLFTTLIRHSQASWKISPLSIPPSIAARIIKAKKERSLRLTVFRRLINGDKIAGRHGNKGVLTRAMPVRDMLYLPNGTSLHFIGNPIAIPSRINLGQIFECLMGISGRLAGNFYSFSMFSCSTLQERSRNVAADKFQEVRALSSSP